MSESSSERSPRERQIDALILEYEQAAEQGRPLNPEVFLKRHAEFAGELREYIENVGHFREVVQPFPSVLEETEPVSGSAPRDLRSGMNMRYFGDYEILEELGHGGSGGRVQSPPDEA
jgi:hypothetical protein